MNEKIIITIIEINLSLILEKKVIPSKWINFSLDRYCSLFLPTIISEEFIFFVNFDVRFGQDFLPYFNEIEEIYPPRVIYSTLDYNFFTNPKWFFEKLNHLPKNRFDQDCYLDTGVLILRNNRELLNGFERAKQWLHYYHGQNLLFPEQEAINFVFPCNRKGILSLKWYCQYCFMNETDFDYAIIHHGEQPLLNLLLTEKFESLWNASFLKVLYFH